jgi:hypothetical protein
MKSKEEINNSTKTEKLWDECGFMQVRPPREPGDEREPVRDQDPVISGMQGNIPVSSGSASSYSGSG